MSDPTTEELNALARAHRPQPDQTRGDCACGAPWPCTAARAVRYIARLSSDLAAARELIRRMWDSMTTDDALGVMRPDEVHASDELHEELMPLWRALHDAHPDDPQVAVTWDDLNPRAQVEMP